MREPLHLRACRQFVAGVCVLSGATAALVLIGWLLHISLLARILPGLATMKPLTALCFGLVAASLWYLRFEPRHTSTPPPGDQQWGRILAGLACAVALLTLVEYLSGRNLGIDDFLFGEAVRAEGVLYPGRMSGATVAAFLLLSASLFLLDAGRRCRYLAQFLALLASFTGLAGVLGYIYGKQALYAMSAYSSMALHTAVLFVLLGFAVLASRPQSGMMAAITSQRLGGVMARRIMPLVLVIPVIMGWLRISGEVSGLFENHFGTVIFALTTVAMLGILLWTSAIWLNRLDEQRRHALDRDLQLAAIVESSTDAILGKSLTGVITSWNKAAERLYGYTAAEIIGKSVNLIVPGGLRKEAEQYLRDIALGKTVARDETFRRHKNGTLVPVSLTISPVRNSEGKIVGAATIAHDISERKRSEAALRESELRNRLLLDSTAEGIYGLDLQGACTFCNQAAVRLLGYSAPFQLLGRNMHALIHHTRPDGSPFPPEECGIYKAYQTTSTSHSDDDLFWRKDGSSFPAEYWSHPITQAGKVIGSVVTFVDITARKQSEEVERQYVQIMGLAQVLVRDLDNRIVYWNAGMERLYGYPAKEALRQVSHELLRSEFPQPLEEIMQQLHRDGRWEGEVVHYARDGKRVVISSQWVLHHDARGVPTRIFEASTNITRRKDLELRLVGQTEELSAQAGELARAESALREHARSLKSVLESMGEGLVAADTEGRFIMWNPAADRILGLRQADLPIDQWPAHYGTYLPDQVTLFPSERLPLVRAIQGQPCDVEMYVRNQERPDGVWLDISARPIYDDSANVIGGVAAFRDITEAKIAQQEIRQLNHELEKRVEQRTAALQAANKEMEAFTYSVSHDLRAPLRHIGGFSRILMEDFAAELPPEAAGHLRRIADSTTRMGTLVDELLALSRLGRQSLRLQPCDLNSLIVDLITMLQPDAEGREVEWRIGRLPPVHCDQTLIRQVFQNLLANALKFTRTRPRAVIEVGHQPREGKTVIFVRDNGVGFDMKYADKLFGVFQRLHRAEEFEGTGVGLASVHRIIHKHAGEIWVEAEVDKGAAFYFTLNSAAQPGVSKEAYAAAVSIKGA